MPLTTRLTSPPAWVKSTRRRSTRAIQSMFSLPLSIEIFAPAETANHSSGTPSRSARPMPAMMRAHSGSARGPSLLLGGPGDGDGPAAAAQVGLGEGARREVGAGLPAAGGEHPEQLVGMRQAAPAK